MSAVTKRELAIIKRRMERQMAAAFDSIVSGIRDSVQVSTLERLIVDGRVDDVIRMLRLDAVTWQPYIESIRESYRTGGETGAAQVGMAKTAEGMLVARFDLRNPRAEQWLARKSSQMVTEIVEAQRSVVRDMLTRGMVRGDNPKTTALDLIGRINASTGRREGGFIGLTSNQAGWVSGVREKLSTLDDSYFGLTLRDRRLDGAIRSAIADGKPLPKSVIDSAVTRYQARAERYRAQTISRTESLNALRAGQWEAMAQVSEEVGEDATKKWDATGDAQTRPDHMAMDGVDVPINAEFEMPNGDEMLYPGDPAGSAENVINCRCAVNYSIDFGARLRRIEGFA